MQYENFSRHLREKYSTRLHVADQLVDQMKYNNRLRVPSTSKHENIMKAQQEISYPLISYLNKFECDKQQSMENKNSFEPYLKECLLAAERVKNNRCNDRDRQICYENLILAQKLERIKKQSGQNTQINLEKDYLNHCQLLRSKANCEHDGLKSINKKLTTKSDPSSSPLQSESKTLISENEDDQATAADVDFSMEYCDSISPIPHKQRNQKFFETENDRVYQHLSKIDMTMVRDTISLPTSQTSRHFSICILPHFDSDMIKSTNNHSKVLPHDRQYAFKKEILYH
jgi:hypothetical protein